MDERNPMCGKAIYAMFFEQGEVRPDFRKEYISLWPGWLGIERLHRKRWLRPVMPLSLTLPGNSTA
jgi:hypothetical protein